jgi:Cdc6-like AAA superfamily ATPase
MIPWSRQRLTFEYSLGFTDGPEFREWLSTERSKLWVYGIPGAGKTILMASAIQEALMHTDPSRALAYFYCDYKDTETHSPILILGSLAKQIAVQHEGCFKRIGELYKCHFHQTPRGGKIEDSLCTLIGDLSRIFSSVMIIVDGLDEVAVDRSGVTHLLQSLNTPSNNIKTLFASRKEVDLEHPLQDYRQLSISAMSSDLRLYVASEIAKRTNDKRLRIRSPDLKEHIMRTLVEKADGM